MALSSTSREWLQFQDATLSKTKSQKVVLRERLVQQSAATQQQVKALREKLACGHLLSNAELALLEEFDED